MTIPPFAGPGSIRPIASDDRASLMRFYEGLSPDSLEARFLGAVPGIGDGTAGFFCGPDHEHREGLVAEASDADGRPMIVGHVCLEPTSPGKAEMAIAVADAWQRLGLGRAMLLGAASWARDHGVATLSASIRGSNGAMLGLIRSMGLPVTADDADAGVINAVIDLGVQAAQPCLTDRTFGGSGRSVSHGSRRMVPYGPATTGRPTRVAGGRRDQPHLRPRDVTRTGHGRYTK